MTMPDHFETIYSQHAPRYDALVSREDYRGHILPALERIRPLKGLEVVEFGAGTGRLTRLLVPLVKSMRAFDVSRHMLLMAAETLKLLGDNWELAVGDNRHMPVDDNAADLTIAGWSLGHLTGWHPDRWREEIGCALREMLRIARPGGTVIILETMGTGQEQPMPPTPALAAYYEVLETEYGFSYNWVRTDYRFESLAEANSLTRFFFGDALADRVLAEKLVILPECTGIWCKHLPSE
jgi:ubiquinone/menaquinone biosynthesis C-methylase UbiE